MCNHGSEDKDRKGKDQPRGEGGGDWDGKTWENLGGGLSLALSVSSLAMTLTKPKKNNGICMLECETTMQCIMSSVAELGC